MVNSPINHYHISYDQVPDTESLFSSSRPEAEYFISVSKPLLLEPYPLVLPLGQERKEAEAKTAIGTLLSLLCYSPD